MITNDSLKEFSSIKAWLESYSSDVPVAKTAFPPRNANGTVNRITAPFIVFLDDVDVEGGDGYNGKTYLHDVTIEFYSADGDDSAFSQWIDSKNLIYSKSENYLSTEQLYQTIFEIQTVITEKR